MNNKFLIVLAFIGIVFLTTVYATGIGGGITPPINPPINMSINWQGNVTLIDSDYREITLDYQSKNSIVLILPNGQIQDFNTRLTFKHKFFYDKYRQENKIYSNYIIQDKFYNTLLYYLNNTDSLTSNINIINGVYTR